MVARRKSSKRRAHVIEEGSRGVLLGRDTFSAGAIRSQTVDATLEGFREIMDGYGVGDVRAVATSAVREARNADMFLDRIAGRTGIRFEVINEAEESRLVYLAVRHTLRGHAAFKGARTLLIEVGGGSTSPMLLRRAQPTRSGVYALGSVRPGSSSICGSTARSCRWRCSSATSRTWSRRFASRFERVTPSHILGDDVVRLLPVVRSSTTRIYTRVAGASMTRHT